MKTFFLSIIIFLICLTHRLIARNGSPTTFDSYGHLFYTRCIREQCPPFLGAINISRLGVDDQYHHPFLLHSLLASIPSNFLLRYQWLINPVLDAIFTVGILLFSIFSGFDTLISIKASVLYIFSPIFFTRIALGPRTASFSPRLFAEIVSNLFFAIFFLPLSLSFGLKILIGSFLASVIFLSSKFSTQALLFITPIGAILVHQADSIISLGCGLLLSCLVTKGSFFLTLRSQLWHLSDYFWKNVKGEMYISDRNSLVKLLILIKNREFYEFFKTCLLNNSWLIVILKYPLFIAIISVITVRAYNISITNIEIVWTLIPIIVSSMIIYIATSWKWLLFLGEAERYLNHVAINTVITGAIVLQSGNKYIFYAILVYGILFTLAEILAGKTFLHQKGNEDDEIILEWLKNQPTSETILCYPYHAAGGWRIVAETNHCWFMPIVWSSSYRSQVREFEGKYPFMQINRFSEICMKFPISTLIVNNKYLDPLMHTFIVPDNWENVDIKTNCLKVYRKIDKSNIL